MAALEPKPRWYHLTPGRFIAALLAVECLLWLSNRLGWPHWHKGYAVLTCVAVVGVALVVMLLWYVAALVFRLRFQFSIRALLVLTVAVALPCSWLAVARQGAHRLNTVVQEIESLDGSLYYDWQVNTQGQNPLEPNWLRKLLGGAFFDEVATVEITEVDLGPRDFPHLEELTELQHLNLEWTRGVHNSEFQRLASLRHLRHLDLRYAEIGDAAVTNLRAFSGLRELRLGATAINDAALEYVGGCANLQSLELAYTEISDAGLSYIESLGQIEFLDLHGSKITDSGLSHLKKLTHLETLDLADTEVKDAGMEHIKCLKQLQSLDITRTRVTREGVKQLKQALPNCKIHWSPPETSKR